MPTTHRVAQGECLSSIAAAYGYADWRTIYDAADNAALRRKRPNPNVLYPGDEVTIPDRQRKTIGRPTGQMHRFVRKRPRTRLRIQLCDGQGLPFAGKKYRLTVDGEAVEGVTDASGLVDQPVTAGNTRGELLLWPDDDPDATCRFKLALGELDPADELTGAQARLANLGFMEPGMTREDGEVTRAALRWFQRAHGLAETGTLDAATSDKLQQIHDE